MRCTDLHIEPSGLVFEDPPQDHVFPLLGIGEDRVLLQTLPHCFENYPLEA
jgi:hypothetical protein